MLPKIDLLAQLFEADSWTGFLDAFVQLRDRHLTGSGGYSDGQSQRPLRPSLQRNYTRLSPCAR